MATAPQLRIGDAEREATAGVLREHYAQGRLTTDELNQRLDASFAATTQGQLDRVTADLPHLQQPWGPMPAAAPRRRGRLPVLAIRGFTALCAALIALLAVSLVVHRNDHHSIPGIAIIVIILVVLRAVLSGIFGRRIRHARRAARYAAYAHHRHHHHHHYHAWGGGPQLDGTQWDGPWADGTQWHEPRWHRPRPGGSPWAGHPRSWTGRQPW
jgi:hypothetical protein